MRIPQPAVIQNLLYVHQCLCPEQVIDWNSILMELAVAPALFIGTNIETLYFLTSCSIVKRVEAIRVKLWRDSVASHVRGKLLQLISNEQAWLTGIHLKLAFYESEYQKLKEAASVLELAVWKAKINESRSDDVVREDVDNKKLKMDESEFRLQCRISCGADHIIESVLPYLLPHK